MPNKKTNYFSIGLFALLGLALIVFGLIFWGSKDRTKDVVYAETYFDESVQGLSVGSPVKYRGMQIGHVVDIATVNSIYKINANANTANTKTLVNANTSANTNMNYNREKPSLLGGAIYVKMAISSRFLNVPIKDFEQIIKTAVANGLRTKLSIQGLTGSAFINFDFEDPRKISPIVISWLPQESYIPSTPSTLAFFGDNAEYMLGELRKIDLPNTFKTLQELLASTNKTIGYTNEIMSTSNKQIMEMLANLQMITQNIKQVSEKAKEQPSALLFGNPPPTLDLNKL